MQTFDAIIVGAGAAGLFCAGVAAQRGLSVLVLDHSDRVAEKIRISGGGRANFTNRDLDVRQPHRHYLGNNPAFCRSALSRYTPAHFVALMQRHGVPFHEKHLGQLFCDRSAQDLIDLLLRECESASAQGGQVQRWQPCGVKTVRHVQSGDQALYELDTDQGTVQAPRLVVATGGLSIPAIGATGWGFDVAQQFGLQVVPTRPALVPLTFDAAQWSPLSTLSGLSLKAEISTGQGKARTAFSEDVLLTHRGLSGPGILQISSYWQPGTPIYLNLLPDVDVQADLLRAKTLSRKRLVNELTQWLPSRLADTWCQHPDLSGITPEMAQRPMPEVPDKALAQLAERVHRWAITPCGTEGYKKAEVTAGGVDTRELSQQTMESKRQPGLYFIGEVLDITGWLGGYNFQWAWSSAHACAQAMADAAGH